LNALSEIQCGIFYYKITITFISRHIYIQNWGSACKLPYHVAHKASRNIVQPNYEVVQTSRLIRLVQGGQLTYMCINVYKLTNRQSYSTSKCAVGKFVCCITECSLSPPRFVTKVLHSANFLFQNFQWSNLSSNLSSLLWVLENKTYPLRAGIQIESWQWRCWFDTYSDPCPPLGRYWCGGTTCGACHVSQRYGDSAWSRGCVPLILQTARSASTQPENETLFYLWILLAH
jgi:hypothetical protein